MIKDIEKVHRETSVQAFSQLKILMHGQVYIPSARPNDKAPGTGIVHIGDVCQTNRPIRQTQRQTIVKLRTQRTNQPLTSIHWNERERIHTLNVSCRAQVDISSEP